MLNLARIELHPYLPKIKELSGKGAHNSWLPNIDALERWGYLDQRFAAELRARYEIRCGYLHSAPIAQPTEDALRSANAAYKLIGVFLGVPHPDLVRFAAGKLEFVNEKDPRFVVFYKPQMAAD